MAYLVRPWRWERLVADGYAAGPASPLTSSRYGRPANGVHLPQFHRPVRTAARQKSAVGAIGHARGVGDVAAEGKEFLGRGSVPQDYHRPGGAGARNAPAVGARGHVID